MRSFTALLLLLPFLAGCASLSQEECQSGDWAAVGSNDAMDGRQPSRFADHIKACAKYDITPDEALYQTGYQKGLTSYCTPSNGFSVGRNGYAYQNICSPATEPEFMRGFLKGSSLHEVETEIAEKEHELARLKSEWHKARASQKDGSDKKIARRFAREMDNLEWNLRSLRFKRDRALVQADQFLQSIEPDV